MTEPTLPTHLRLREKIDDKTQRVALRAVLIAARLLGLAAGTHLRALRALNDPLVEAHARVQEAELRARLAFEIVEILIVRFSKIPEQRRPHLTPTQRFRALEIKNLLGWAAKEMARVLLVCPNTILNWERSADPRAKSVGVTVRAPAPIRRAADAAQSLSKTLVHLGLGADMVSRILARVGWVISARSVDRYGQDQAVPLLPTPEPDQTTRQTTPVFARFIHHTWMMDVTIVKRFLGPEIHLAGVFDSFSRIPLALQVFQQKPDAPDMRRLFHRAAQAFGKPKYVITDLGGEFTGGSFKKAVKRLGTLHRFAASDNIHATAQLERFWRTLKESANFYGLRLPLTVEDLERRLSTTLFHYTCFRPHEGFKGATPAEVFWGLTPAPEAAVEAPRGRPGEGPSSPSFTIAFLDDGKRLPILKIAA